MGSALVVVKMSTSAGNKFSNVHAVKQLRNGTGFGLPDQAMINDILGPRLINGDFSAVNVGAGGGPVDTSVCEAILRMHQGMHATHVTIDQLYISDGKTAGAPTGPYAVIPVGITCNSYFHGGFAVNATNCSPLNTAMLIQKQPALLGLRAGRMWLRAALRREDVTDGDRDGALTEPVHVARLRNTWEAAEGGSGIAEYYNGQTYPNGLVMYGQAQFYNKADVAANPILDGVLKITQSIRNMQFQDAQSRQLKRGRKQQPTTAQIAAALRARGLFDEALALEEREGDLEVTNTGVYPEVVEPLPEATEVDDTTPTEESLLGGSWNAGGQYIGPADEENQDPPF